MMRKKAMKIAICSDIHGNIQAFEAFCKNIENENISKLFILGDIAGYGGNPNECIEKILEMKSDGKEIFVIKGNHDEVVSSNNFPTGFNTHAARAVLKHQQIVTPSNKKWLNNLPYDTEFEIRAINLKFVHGSIEQHFDYITDEYAAARVANKLAQLEYKVLFCGHTHFPIVWLFEMNQNARLNKPISNGTQGSVANCSCINIKDGKEIKIQSNQIAIVNVGSIGQPRDLNPQSCFVTLDTDTLTVKYHRFSYDTAAASMAILNTGMGQWLSDRVLCGL